MIWRRAMSIVHRDRLSILIFHRVLREPDPILRSEPCAADFEALLRHLIARFTVLPLSDAVHRLSIGTLPPCALAITFDDGYADNLSVAGPILRKLGVSATIFVATGFLDGFCMWNDLVIEAFRSTAQRDLDLTRLGLGSYMLSSVEDRRSAIDNVLAAMKYQPPEQRVERAQQLLRMAEVPAPRALMLTRDSLRSLHEFGFDVGAHTVNHPILACISSSAAWDEIWESKRELERTLERTITLFAYPNGRPGKDYTHEHVRMVREAGFAAALSTAPGAASRNSDPLQLPRFTPWSREPMKFDLLMVRNLFTGMEGKAA